MKLAAQIDDVNHLEPLPDLDFNIKSGNLLIGIADKEDAENRLGAGQLDLGGEIEEIVAIADRLADACTQFAQLQASDVESDHLSEKQALAARQFSARRLADELLHRKREETETFDDWCESHRPFHWFVEFPHVWSNGGFDVVIGNPPYIQKKNVTGYRWIGYETQNCPDLYAVCMERASTLLNDQGRFAMIVMHSLCFSRNFGALREHLSERLQAIWVSSYSRIPDGLFSGSARVRNAILLGARNAGCRFFTSSCRRWLTEFRPTLFSSVEYVAPPDSLQILNGKGMWPFVDSEAVSAAFAKLVTVNQPLSNVLVQGAEHQLAYKRVAQYMLGVSQEPPPARGNATTQRYGYLSFSDALHRDLALVMLAGRWGYLWWMVFSDEFDVIQSTLSAFPADMERLCALLDSSGASDPEPLDIELVRSLVIMSNTLKNEMPKHLAWKLNAGVQVGRYNMLGCRHITDEADLLLAQIWGIEEAYEIAGNLRDRMVFGNKE
ncbi:MAG: Eco57I restriction-modification methylase domain-containing protein [Acidimicrobiaceae bacterium]|nr:Eco57I restriction-modification methylase domain-containing protein [Acidimicrobiaceae bacterium]